MCFFGYNNICDRKEIMIAPNNIKTDNFIKLLNELFEEEYEQPKSVSLPKLYQIAALVRLVTGEEIGVYDFDGVQDVYDLIGWEYKIKGDSIDFVRRKK